MKSYFVVVDNAALRDDTSSASEQHLRSLHANGGACVAQHRDAEIDKSKPPEVQKTSSQADAEIVKPTPPEVPKTLSQPQNLSSNSRKEQGVAAKKGDLRSFFKGKGVGRSDPQRSEVTSNSCDANAVNIEARLKVEGAETLEGASGQVDPDTPNILDDSANDTGKLKHEVVQSISSFALRDGSPTDDKISSSTSTGKEAGSEPTDRSASEVTETTLNDGMLPQRLIRLRPNACSTAEDQEDINAEQEHINEDSEYNDEDGENEEEEDEQALDEAVWDEEEEVDEMALHRRLHAQWEEEEDLDMVNQLKALTKRRIQYEAEVKACLEEDEDDDDRCELSRLKRIADQEAEGLESEGEWSEDSNEVAARQLDETHHQHYLMYRGKQRQRRAVKKLEKFADFAGREARPKRILCLGMATMNDEERQRLTQQVDLASLGLTASEGTSINTSSTSSKRLWASHEDNEGHIYEVVSAGGAKGKVSLLNKNRGKR